MVFKKYHNFFYYYLFVSQIIFFFSLKVRYAISEYACTAVDVIARRLRLSFLNVQAAEEVLPTIISIMADTLKWSKSRQRVYFSPYANTLLYLMHLIPV